MTYIPILLSLTPTPHPSRSSQSPELSSLCYRAASHSLSVLHVVVYVCQCYSLCPSHPLLLLLCPHIPSLCLHLYSCPAKRSISTTESEVLSWENYNTGGFLHPCAPASWNLYALPGYGEAETGTGGRSQGLRTTPVLLWKVGDIFRFFFFFFGLLVSYRGGCFHLKHQLCINLFAQLLRVCLPFICVWFSDTLWAVAHQAPLSMGFSGRECWSGLPSPSRGTVFLVVAVESLSRVRLFATPRTAACQGFPVLHHLWDLAQTHVHWAGDAIQPSHPLSSPSIFASIRVFSSESALCIRWPKVWSFSFSFAASSEYSGLISCRMDWLDVFAVQGTLSLLRWHLLKRLTNCTHTPSDLFL